MTATPADSIPSGLNAGDTAIWSRSLPDYPASAGWVLAYTLVGLTTAYNFSATADGDNFAINVLASTTAAWVPGTYKVQEYVALAGERQTIGITVLRIAPDLSVMTAGQDLRTHARKVLDSIETWLETKAPVAGSMEINGRKIAWYPIADLLKLRDRYRVDVMREENVSQPGRYGHRINSVL
jgi:hypothetical protein